MFDGVSRAFNTCGVNANMYPGIVIFSLVSSVPDIKKCPNQGIQFSLLGFLVFARLAIVRGGQWNSPMRDYIEVLNYVLLSLNCVYRSDWLILKQWFYVVEIACRPTIFFAKYHILRVPFRKIAPKRLLTWFVWNAIQIIVGLTALYYAISISTFIFTSVSRERGLNSPTKDLCINHQPKILVSCFLNATFEIGILILAVKWVCQFQLGIGKKIGLITSVMVGLL